jgi:transposase
VCAATTVDGRILAWTIERKSYDKFKFIDFLKELRYSFDRRKTLHVFLDGMRAHHAYLVRDYCASNRLRLHFNSGYSSEFMPIEKLWLLLKRIVRREMVATEKVKLTEANIRKLIK